MSSDAIQPLFHPEVFRDRVFGVTGIPYVTIGAVFIAAGADQNYKITPARTLNSMGDSGRISVVR